MQGTDCKSAPSGMSPVQSYNNWSNTCFVKGTKILLKNGTYKNIEEVSSGDEILSVNMNTMKIEPDEVIIVPKSTEEYNQIQMKFDNGIEIISSPHHPFYVKDKGWCVFDVKMAQKDLSFQVKEINKGDTVYLYHNGELIESKIVEINNLKSNAQMYNIKYVRKNNTFFANGILVHNRFEN